MWLAAFPVPGSPAKENREHIVLLRSDQTAAHRSAWKAVFQIHLRMSKCQILMQRFGRVGMFGGFLLCGIVSLTCDWDFTPECVSVFTELFRMQRSSEHSSRSQTWLVWTGVAVWRKCFLLTCAASAGVSAYLCGAEVLPPSPHSSDLLSTSSLLEMFHSRSLLTANLILTSQNNANAGRTSIQRIALFWDYGGIES